MYYIGLAAIGMPCSPDHSNFRLSTGFFKEALYDWYRTVSEAITRAKRAATRKVHMPISMRKAKFSSQFFIRK